MGVDFSSKGKLRPTTIQIGKRMERETGPSNSGNQKVAVESYDREARRRGIKPLQFVRKRAAPVDNLVTVLDAGAWVSVDVDYSVFNRMYNGKYSSSPSFMGLHSVGAMGKKRINGTMMSRLFDPLADGRFPGVWNGPRWVPLALIKRASAKIWGKGKWGGGVIRYSKAIADPMPLPPEPDECEEAENDLRDERERTGLLEAALSESRDSFLDLKITLESKVSGLIIDIEGMLEEIDIAMPPSTSDIDLELDGNDAGSPSA